MGAIRRTRAATWSSASLIGLALVAGGCGGGSSGAASATAAPAKPAAAGVLSQSDVAADCRSSVPADGKPAPASLLSPPGRIAVLSDAAGVTNGFVDQTPGQFLAAWRARKGVDVEGENEGIEGEVYVTSDDTRIEFKLRKVCPTGSVFSARVD